MTTWKWCVMAALAAGLAGSASAEMKIAVVDMAQLVKAHPDTASADALLEKEVEAFEDEQKDMKQAHESLKAAFETARKEASNKALSDEARDAKIRAAEECLGELRDYERKVQEDLGRRQKEITDLRMRMQKRIVGKILDRVREYAAKQGYDLVLDAAGTGVSGVEIVLYRVAKIDITAELKKTIEKEPAEKAN